jgi:Tfp pilus assembly protein FimV
LESEARVQELQEQLAAAQQQVQQLEERGSVLAAERDAAARNLLRAETELNDVGEYSTKMFRQVSTRAIAVA